MEASVGDEQKTNGIEYLIFKSVYCRQNGAGHNFRVVTTDGDILSLSDNQQAREAKPTEPVKFAFKPVTVGIDTTASNIVEILALNRKLVLQSSNRIIS